jgi:hypothetical protein
MTEKPLPTAPDFLGALPALKRAAQRALELAIATNTPCIVMRDGQIVDIAREHRLRIAQGMPGANA